MPGTAVSAGAVVVLAVAYRPWLLLLAVLTAYVCWSHVELRDHETAQVCWGTVLGVAVGGVYWLVILLA